MTELSLRARRIGHGVERTLHWVSGILGAAAALCLLALLLASTVDVAGRQVRDTGLPGVVEYGELLLVAIASLSLAYTCRRGGHVAVDFVTSRLPARPSAWAQAAGLLAVLPAVGWVVVASAELSWVAWSTGDYRMGLVRAPLWPARFAVTFGFAALLGELTVSLYRCVRRALAPEGS